MELGDLRSVTVGASRRQATHFSGVSAIARSR